MKLQCVVTSYIRPKYLKPCIESMRQDDIELYIVDGGSDDETLEYIKSVADGYHFMKGNPGADVLKNEGIERFVTQPEFVMSSDDLVFQKGWTDRLYSQYKQINSKGFKYPMIASPTTLVYQRHKIEYPDHFKLVNGVEFFATSCAMVAGTIMDTAATKRVGNFPVYGVAGHGDVAIGRRFKKIGLQVGYFSSPTMEHIGGRREDDYPEYSAVWAEDVKEFWKKAENDDWQPPTGPA